MFYFFRGGGGGAVQKDAYFVCVCVGVGGTMKLWIFLGAIAKLDCFCVLFLNILGFFKVKIKNWNIFWRGGC